MIYDTVAFIVYAKKDKNDEIYSIFSRDVFFYYQNTDIRYVCVRTEEEIDLFNMQIVERFLIVIIAAYTCNSLSASVIVHIHVSHLIFNSLLLSYGLHTVA